jgi:glycosyltransferase involved in cell wall biosynthesis
VRLLVLHFGKLNVNSVIQAFHLGEELSAEGLEVTLCGKGPAERIGEIGEPSFEVITYDDLSRTLRAMGREPVETIVCAWTPREIVRRATERAVAELGCPYVVHLEDNEEHLLSSALRRPYDELRRLPAERLDELCGEDFINPAHYPRFLEQADAVTVITEELNEFNLAGRPHHLARPGVDGERFDPDLAPAVTRQRLGLRDDDFVIVYHGIGHWANLRELFSLYTAVKLLQRRGRRVRLVRLGSTKPGGVDPRTLQALRDGEPDLGDLAWREVPGYLALADAYVQPGAPDDFNRYRLPSKLPEFLAMGRPVVLPACNLGNDLSDGENALLLRRGDAVEIAARIARLQDDRELAELLGRGARQFAIENLSWPRNAAALADFYRGVLASARPPVAA